MMVIAAALQVTVAGQSPAAATKTTRVATTSVPRTEWGQPDLRGIWDFGSATPLQRPDGLTAKEYLSDEEARRLTSACTSDFRALVTAAQARHRELVRG